MVKRNKKEKGVGVSVWAGSALAHDKLQPQTVDERLRAQAGTPCKGRDAPQVGLGPCVAARGLGSGREGANEAVEAAEGGAMDGTKFFLVRSEDRTLVWLGNSPNDREQAKIKARRAFGSFGGNPDKYEVTPLTELDDIVHVEVTTLGRKERKRV
jgi:hypothetical protein